MRFMITKKMWWNFEFKVKSKWGAWNSNYTYEESKMALLLLCTILGTPFTIILDILTLPIQIIYRMCLKKIKKIRIK